MECLSRAIEKIDFRFPAYRATRIADLAQFPSSFLSFSVFENRSRTLTARKKGLKGKGVGKKLKSGMCPKPRSYTDIADIDRPTDRPWTNALSKPSNSIENVITGEVSRSFSVFVDDDTNRLLSVRERATI